jgi:hypothetical protein
MIKTLYIDDSQQDLERYNKKFETDDRTKDRFRIIMRNSPKSAQDYKQIYQDYADLMLIDFDLAKPDLEGDATNISGLTLSTELRQRFPEAPMVLFTRPNIFKAQDYSVRILSNIDDIVYKKDLFMPDSTLLDSLYELAIGFKKLRNKKTRKWVDLLEIINAPEIEYDDLKLANPPTDSGNDWSVSDAAAWIRNTLIKFPGLLYGPMHAATFLGISKDAFLSNPILEVFSEAKYSGVFSPTDGRWWKTKLQQIANAMMIQKERNLLLREAFPMAWERTRKTAIERSVCVFSGESPAEWVCYILKKPMMIKYSLSYKPDSRPSVMDEARVSFEAIRTSNEVNDELFDSLGKELLPEIRRMRKPRK